MFNFPQAQDSYQKQELPTQFYFAVGNLVPLYDVRIEFPICNFMPRQGYKGNYNPVYDYSKGHKVQIIHNPKNSQLSPYHDDGSLKLFKNLKDAIDCRNDLVQDTAKLNEDFGFCFPSHQVPIYVVSIHNPRERNLLKTSSETYNNTHPIEVYCIKLNNYFFLNQPNHKSKNNLYAQFQALWEQGFTSSAPKTNFEERVQGSLKALFQSYSAPIYSKLTRHHHREIRGILAYLETSPSLEKLDEFFKEKMAQAEANKKNKSADKTCFSNFNMSFFNKKTRLKNKTINPDGHYYQMLKFSIEQLKAYQSMHQLDGIDEYLELTQDTKIIFCELNA